MRLVCSQCCVKIECLALESHHLPRNEGVACTFIRPNRMRVLTSVHLWCACTCADVHFRDSLHCLEETHAGHRPVVGTCCALDTR